VSGDLKMNMNKVNINWRWLLLITCLAITAENTLASSSSAVDALVLRQKNERLIASAFHDLAEVRLEQKEWDRAIKLARKSLRLAGGSDKDSYKLRLKNWVVITQACESMADWKCARNARNNAQALAQALAR
jgi:hypothetical protein